MNTRTPITLLVLVLVVAGSAWYGWTRVNAPAPNPFAEEPACVDQQIGGGGKLSRGQVVVNVYNASARDDLAARTLRKLTKLGFAGGSSANAPAQLRAGVVTIVDPEPDSPQVRLVRNQFKGKVRVQQNPDLGEGVDVVVGQRYRGLRQRAPRSVTVRTAQEICVPSGRSGSTS